MVQGGDDRRSAAAPDVEVGLAAAPVGDGEDVVGDHQPERHHGQRPADDQCGYLVGGMIDGQVQPGGAEGGEDDRGRPLPPVPPPPGGHQRVEDPHQRQGQRGDGPRRLRVALPGPEDTDADGPHPADLQRHDRDQQRRGEEYDQVGGEMPEPAERDKHRDGPPRDQPHRPRRRRAALTSSIRRVSQAARTVATARRTVKSARVMMPRTAGTDMPAHRTPATPASSRYQRMLWSIWRGSGGGSPEGRRRRPRSDAAIRGVTSDPSRPGRGVGSVVMAAPPP